MAALSTIACQDSMTCRNRSRLLSWRVAAVQGPTAPRVWEKEGILAVAPAVVNAVHNAVATRLQAVPLVSEMVWKEINKIKSI